MTRMGLIKLLISLAYPNSSIHTQKMHVNLQTLTFLVKGLDCKTISHHILWYLLVCLHWAF